MIYFIQVEQYIKVGYTSDLRKRFKKYITENPNDPKLLYTLNGGYDIESKIHKQLIKWKHRREWFHVTEDCMKRIKEILIENKDNIEKIYVKRRRTKNLHLKVLTLIKECAKGLRIVDITLNMKIEIANKFGVTLPTISKHIKKLIELKKISYIDEIYFIN